MVSLIGVDTEAFNGEPSGVRDVSQRIELSISPAGPDPLWNDLLKRHAQQPIHLLVGGGDQIYCDAIAREPEITPWIDETDMDKKMQSEASLAFLI